MVKREKYIKIKGIAPTRHETNKNWGRDVRWLAGRTRNALCEWPKCTPAEYNSRCDLLKLSWEYWHTSWTHGRLWGSEVSRIEKSYRSDFRSRIRFQFLDPLLFLRQVVIERLDRWRLGERSVLWNRTKWKQEVTIKEDKSKMFVNYSGMHMCGVYC